MLYAHEKKFNQKQCFVFIETLLKSHACVARAFRIWNDDG